MTRQYSRLSCILLLPCLLLTGNGIAGTSIDLSAEASRPAANDLARATVFTEITSPTPGESARRANAAMQEAINTAKTYSRVTVQTASTHTYPVHARGGGKVEAWRVRSELALESTDIPGLSELIGKLQANLGVSGITLAPSPETRRKAEDLAYLDAIAAFKSRARLVADAFGKPYQIKHLSLGGQSFRPSSPVLRSSAMASMEAAPMPIESGESQVSARVSGQIELAD